MREQAIQAKMIKHLEGLGGYVVKVIKASKGGVPDLIGCINGVFIAIEVKRPETKHNTSPLQDINIDKIITAGGVAGIAWDIESLEVLLKDTL